MADRITLDTLLRWPLALTEEVLRLPETLRDARHLASDLGRVTARLAETLELLSTTVAGVDRADLPGLTSRLSALTDQLESMAREIGAISFDSTVRQVDSIERSVTELRNTLFAGLQRLPGSKRLLDAAAASQAQGRDAIDPAPPSADRPR